LFVDSYDEFLEVPEKISAAMVRKGMNSSFFVCFYVCLFVCLLVCGCVDVYLLILTKKPKDKKYKVATNFDKKWSHTKKTVTNKLWVGVNGISPNEKSLALTP
jgi:hypothetical protein